MSAEPRNCDRDVAFGDRRGPVSTHAAGAYAHRPYTNNCLDRLTFPR